MRCKACDAELNDAASTRKDEDNTFVDLCYDCLTISNTTIYEDKEADKRDMDVGLTPHSVKYT